MGVDEIAPNEIARQFGERVKMLRRAAGMTQADLAEAIGKHKTTITHIEAGNQQTLLPDVYLIARALGVPVGELVEGEEPVDRLEMHLRMVHLSKTRTMLQEQIDTCSKEIAAIADILAVSEPHMTLERLLDEEADAEANEWRHD